LPERIYPVLAILSGVVIAGMGVYLVLQRFLPSAVAHSHSHSHTHRGHHHSHGGVSHSHHDHHDHHHEHAPANLDPRGVSARQLLLLGITGGMIPCPAALVVLLTATALGRVGFGLFLIVCFSVGLAAVLIVMGLMAIYAGRLIKHLPVEGPLIQRWLPMASAVMITVIGCVIAIRGLMTSSILQGKI
jgi:ABC-type nickel/cobalt efflux system permease component RcnA